MLSPGGLVERESDVGIVEGFADQVAAFWRDVGVFLAEDLGAGVLVGSLDVESFLSLVMLLWVRDGCIP